MESNQNRLTAIAYAPRWALKVIAINAAVWLVVVPVALMIKTGHTTWMIIALAGAAFIPLLVVGSIVQRILLWFALVRFWFWQVLAACVGIAGAGVVLAAIALTDVSWIDAPVINHEGRAILIALAVAVLIIVIGALVFRRRRARVANTPEKSSKRKSSIPARRISDSAIENGHMPASRERPLTYMRDWQARRK